MKKVLIASLMGMALVSACGTGGTHASGQGGVVKFVPLGGIQANSYGLAYETCRSTGLTQLARELHATPAQPQVAADALAQTTFTAKAQPFAIRGCLDALAGRHAAPPVTTSPAPAASPRTP